MALLRSVTAPARLLLGMALLAGLAAAAAAQNWTSAYDEGLKAAAKGEWTEARKAFQAAAAYRPEDVSGPTVLPGPPTERRRWREGAPYSPNFLAAYSAYRAGIAAAEGQSDLLKTAASEMEALLAKGQNSQDAYYFLNLIYAKLGDAAKREDLSKRYAGTNGKLTFKVDQAALTPEDRAQVQALNAPSGMPETKGGTPGTNIPETPANQVPNAANPRAGIPTVLASGVVPAIPTKFALIIANSESRMKDGAVPFALEDARRMKDALVASAGYDPANIEIVTNSTSAQTMATARALSQRFPEAGTLFLYYTGAGTNIDGHDFLAGVDTEMATDTSSMIRKIDLYRPFVEKGASIFAFYQVSRPIVNGRYFGAELPELGRIAQSQATIPGETVRGIFREGTLVGLYSDAFISTLGEFRSNRIPINEFAWQVFYRIRRGDAGTSGGGGRQTPTLPTLVYLGADARF